jgi:hypothetical protein
MITITEKLLQYIWQFQYFNNTNLVTESNEKISILNKGTLNTNQGPDFLNAKIKIGNTILVGNIELHTHSSHWHKHKHATDQNYQNIILHVVWKHDLSTEILHQYPILTLAPYIAKTMLNKYALLQEKSSFIPCEKMIYEVTELQFNNWKDRLIVERLEQKTKLILKKLELNQNNWEETFWQQIAASFGVKVNSEAFEAIAIVTSNQLLAKNKSSFLKIEALLFGQSGMLQDSFTDAYAIMLQKEYAFLKSKYKLQHTTIRPQFLRMRPANFPTLRLSQLAQLVFNSNHLFSKVLECNSYKEVLTLFKVSANDYWQTHYQFDDEPHLKKEKNLGVDMIHLIIINTVIPTLFAYGIAQSNENYKAKAIEWLEAIPAEVNHITKGFKALQIKVKTALDAQALIHLNQKYCTEKKCLQCAVGISLLKK